MLSIGNTRIWSKWLNFNINLLNGYKLLIKSECSSSLIRNTLWMRLENFRSMSGHATTTKYAPIPRDRYVVGTGTKCLALRWFQVLCSRVQRLGKKSKLRNMESLGANKMNGYKKSSSLSLVEDINTASTPFSRRVQVSNIAFYVEFSFLREWYWLQGGKDDKGFFICSQQNVLYKRAKSF